MVELRGVVVGWGGSAALDEISELLWPLVLLLQ
jgi:hypothetical protein